MLLKCIVPKNNKIQPNSQVVRYGDALQLTCLSYSPVLWFHYNKTSQISTRSERHLTSSGMFNLFIKRATLSDGGIYFCYGYDQTSFLSTSDVTIHRKDTRLSMPYWSVA